MQLGFRALIFAGVTACSAVACAQTATPTAPQPTSPVPFPSRVLRQTTFNIPFTVETSRQPAEVQLYLSRDRGQTWKLYARQNPSAKFFPFHATQDGEYWFASQIIDTNRAPAAIDGRQPELHVVIDTAQPTLDVQAVIGPSREIQVSWHSTDPTIDPASMKIEYQAGREQPWRPVSFESPAASNSTVAGRLSFRPQNAWVELQIRAEISDFAKNRTVVTRRLTWSVATTTPPTNGQPGWRPVASGVANSTDRPIPLPPTSPSNATDSNRAPPPVDTPVAARGNQKFPISFGTPPVGFGPAKSGTGPSSSRAAGIPLDPYVDVRPSQPDAAAITPVTSSLPPTAATGSERSVTTSNSNAQVNTAPTTEWKTTATARDHLAEKSVPNESLREQLVDGNGYQPQPSQVQPLVSQQIVPPQQGSANDLDATAPSALRADSNRVNVHHVRMTSATRFELDYEFDAAAANGVRSVELWGTRDRGQTWSRWQIDDDRRSPVDVQVEREGTFGFRIVVVGNNGLAGIAPRNGDDADIWVGVDTTAPQVQITTATYGEGEQTGKLDIRWTASDSSFGEGPITILFSDQVTGPWTTIAAGIPNTGRHFWPIDPRVPEQLYLKIEARDRAGNQAEYRLPDSINLAGFTPKARIRGIRPLTETPSASPADSTMEPTGSAPSATRNPYVFR